MEFLHKYSFILKDSVLSKFPIMQFLLDIWMTLNILEFGCWLSCLPGTVSGTNFSFQGFTNLSDENRYCKTVLS